MNEKEKQALEQIKILFESQKFAVLSTQKSHQPYASLVGFASTADLGQIIFLTPNTTRKYDNLVNNPQAAILINDSMNLPDDICKAVSVTATGTAVTVEGHDKQKLLDIYLKKHPNLQDFSNAPTTALVSLNVESYFMVNRFQDVIEIQLALK